MSITIPISQVSLLADLIAAFQARGVICEVTTTAKDFHIQVTGINRAA